MTYGRAGGRAALWRGVYCRKKEQEVVAVAGKRGRLR